MISSVCVKGREELPSVIELAVCTVVGEIAALPNAAARIGLARGIGLNLLDDSIGVGSATRQP